MFYLDSRNLSIYRQIVLYRNYKAQCSVVTSAMTSSQPQNLHMYVVQRTWHGKGAVLHWSICGVLISLS